MQRIPRYPLTTGGQENIRSNTGVHLPGNDWILLLVQYIGFLPFLLCLLQHSGSRIDCIFSWSTGFLRKVDMPFFYVYCNILIWEKNQYCYILAKQALCGFTILILEIPVFDVPWRHHAHGHNRETPTINLLKSEVSWISIFFTTNTVNKNWQNSWAPDPQQLSIQ